MRERVLMVEDHEGHALIYAAVLPHSLPNAAYLATSIEPRTVLNEVQHGIGGPIELRAS